MPHEPPEHVVASQASSAMTVLQSILERVQAGQPADSVLQHLYRQHREYGSRDRRLYSNLVFSYFRWKGWLDLAPALPLATRAAAAYRLDFPDPPPAVARLAPLAPAPESLDTLPAKARQVARWLALPEPPPLAALLPSAIRPLLARAPLPIGQDPETALIEAFQTRPPTWLRVRPGAEASVQALCASQNLVPIPHPRLPQAWQLPDTTRLADLLSQAGGKLDIQDVASQAIGLVAAPAPDSSWWDVCAGSCGKSLQLAELACGRIRILATDIRESILNEAERRLQKGGWADCIRLQRLDAAQDPLPSEQFDGVLVDAPCSGTGTWSRNPDARWRWKPEALAELTALQATLLDRAAGCVKPGGTLLYATCSLTTAENTELIARFLQAHSDYTLSPFTHPLTGAPCPGQTYFWPWDGPGSGLFAARLIRRHS